MGDLRVIRTVEEMHHAADQMRGAGHRIGLVPTMGYLHEGHLTLVRRAARVAERVVVSVFVNPIQFGPREDIGSYPRDFDRDLDLIGSAGCDLVYAPAAEEMYLEGRATYVDVDRLAEHLCGASRPGHFRGVATVVTKLFTAVKPHVAIFGQKDGQQAAVVRRMVRDLNLDVEVLVSPTVREPDGLAMSSRNRYLSPEERSEATVLYHALQEARALVRTGVRRSPVVIDAVKRTIESRPRALIDYVAVVDAWDLQPTEEVSGEVLLAVAARFGRARLIDNIVLCTG